jgi:hypothetical protein
MKAPFATTKVPPTKPGGGIYTNPTQSSNGLGKSTVTPDPINNPVIISVVTHDSAGLEKIVIQNISEKTQDINGYTLLDPNSGETINIFGIKLSPGGTFNVYNGSKAKDQADGLAWRETPILLEDGDAIYLLNHAGRLIAQYTYYP